MGLPPTCSSTARGAREGPFAPPAVNFVDCYGSLDRLLRRIAFRSSLARRTRADVEAAIFADRIRSAPLEYSVFVTALPRSGIQSC